MGLRGTALAAVGLALALPAGAQQWSARLSQPSLDHRNVSVAVSPDGGSYVTGNLEGASDDVFALRFDAGGNLEWQLAFVSPGADVQQAPVALADGGLVVSASLTGAAPTDAIALLALNPDGSARWQTVVDTPDRDALWALARDGTGFAGAGFVGRDMAVGRFDDSGAPSMLSSFAVGTSTSTATALTPTADGGLVVVGMGQAPGRADADGLVMRLDAAGAVTWALAVGRAGPEGATAVIPLGDDFIVAGQSRPVAAGPRDAWIVRITGDGSLAWHVRFAATGDELPFALAAAPDGDVVMIGWTSSFGAVGLAGWCVRVGPDGTVRWQRLTEVSGGGGPLLLTSAVVDGAGFLVAGSINDVTADLFVTTQDQRDIPRAPCLSGRGTDAFVGSPAVVVTPFTPVVTVQLFVSSDPALPMATLAHDLTCNVSCTVPGAVSDVLAGAPPLRVEPGGASLSVERLADATAYHVYADALGSWYAPSAATGTQCLLTSWRDPGDGTVGLDVSLPPGSWTVVTAANACGEGADGARSDGRERTTLGTWERCGAGP